MKRGQRHLNLEILSNNGSVSKLPFSNYTIILTLRKALVVSESSLLNSLRFSHRSRVEITNRKQLSLYIRWPKNAVLVSKHILLYIHLGKNKHIPIHAKMQKSAAASNFLTSMENLYGFVENTSKKVRKLHACASYIAPCLS